MGFYQLKLLDIQPLGDKTWVVIGIGGLLFTLGAATPLLIRRATLMQIKDQHRPQISCMPSWMNVSTLRKLLYILLPLNIVAVALKAYSLIRYSGVSLSYFLNDPTNTRILIIKEQESTMIYGFPVITVLLINLFSLSFLSLPLSGIFLAIKKRFSALPFIPVLLSIVQGLLTFSRFRIATDVISFGYGFFITKMHLQRFTSISLSTRVKQRRHRFALVSLGLLILGAFVVNDVMLKKSVYLKENEGEHVKPILLNMYWYIVSPIAALDTYLKNDPSGGSYSGAFTFRFVAKWLARFGFVDDSLVPPTHLPNVNVPYPTNVFSWYRSFYEDFSLAGVLVMPYLIGVLSMIVFLAIRSHITLTRVVAMSIICTLIIFSYYGFMLADNFYFMLLGFAFVLELLLKTRKPTQHWIRGSRISKFIIPKSPFFDKYK